MLKKLHGALLSIFLFSSIATLNGCVALVVGAAAGAGTLAFVKGILEYNVDQPISKAHKAVLAGLRDLGVIVRSDEVTSHNTTTKAEFEKGTDLTVELESLTELATKIKIRVGVFGDEAKSQMVLEAIKKRL